MSTFKSMSKLLGPKGAYLILCRWLGVMPFPADVRIFGKVSTIPEILNIRDNFAKRELRDDFIENIIATSVNPVVIDCGVNVGVTVRWWLYLNPSCRVFGMDMIQEAHDFTKHQLKKADVYTGITAALSSVDNEQVTISFTDPLDGSNSIGGLKKGQVERHLVTARIDTLLSSYRLENIELIKIDIEGYAAKALAGAPDTLAKTNHVILEIHSEQELREANSILINSGFQLRDFHERNLWYIKNAI